MALDGQRMTLAVTLAIWLTGGTGIGLIYFRLVQHSVDLLLSPRRGASALAVGLVFFRLLGLGGLAVFAVWQGAIPLLAATAGLLIGRWWILRTTRVREI
jgi:hypothetical protein